MGIIIAPLDPPSKKDSNFIDRVEEWRVNHVGGAARTHNASRWPPTVVHFVIILNRLCNYKIGVKMGRFWGFSPSLDTLETNEHYKNGLKAL